MDQCTICLDNVFKGCDYHKTECGHVFHTSCLNEWLGHNDSCPVCRRKVDDSDAVVWKMKQRRQQKEDRLREQYQWFQDQIDSCRTDKDLVKLVRQRRLAK